jgi:hypothetical protein
MLNYWWRANLPNMEIFPDSQSFKKGLRAQMSGFAHLRSAQQMLLKEVKAKKHIFVSSLKYNENNKNGLIST